MESKINEKLFNSGMNKNSDPDLLVEYYNFMNSKGFAQVITIIDPDSPEPREVTFIEAYEIMKNLREKGEDYVCIFTGEFGEELSDDFVKEFTDYFIRNHLIPQKINLINCKISLSSLQKLKELMAKTTNDNSIDSERILTISNTSKI